ncbi:MAG: gamma-glutamyltransferase family protein [Sulfolobaceae archaeon]
MPYSIGNKIVATQHYLATQVGIKVLENGGNAFDAAIAISAVLGVVLPYSSGLGGDGFLLAKTPEGVIAYNASGWAPKNSKKPKSLDDPNSVLVPGLVDLWEFVYERYCTMDANELLRPAISLATNGFHVSRGLYNASIKSLRPYESWKRVYGGLRLAEKLKLPNMAEVLKRISKDFREFYEGKVSEEIISGLLEHNVPVTHEDFAKFRGERVDPIRLEYRDGYLVYELPPNSQGITTLQLLKLMQLTEVNKLPYEDNKRISRLLDLYKIAYEDRNRYVSDPRFNKIDVYSLIREEYLIQRLNSGRFSGKLDPANDTTFFLVSDGENEVGFIQSLFHHFGSGIVVKDIPFNNRGLGFTDGANDIAPHKRPLHTLSILYAEKEREAIMIGCAGADLRPQIHALVFTYVVDYGMEIDQAVNAPRFAYTGDKVLVEKRLNYPGVLLDYYAAEVGIVQAMRRVREGVYIGVADPRSDGISLSLIK